MRGDSPADADRSGPTLAAFVRDVWAPRARRRLAPKTWQRDAVVYEKHVRPVLGDRPIATIDIEELTDLDALRERVDPAADNYLFRTGAGRRWVETDWRNYLAPLRPGAGAGRGRLCCLAGRPAG